MFSNQNKKRLEIILKHHETSSSTSLNQVVGSSIQHPTATSLPHGIIVGIDGLLIVTIVEVAVGQPHQKMRSILRAMVITG